VSDVRMKSDSLEQSGGQGRLHGCRVVAPIGQDGSAELAHQIDFNARIVPSVAPRVPVGSGSLALGDPVLFTAPESTLDDFSVTVSDFDTPFPFVSQVYAWDGSETIGPALYTSGVGDTTSSLTTYTYSPDMHVTAGDQ
jgi:hypothetical protein